MMGAGEVRHWHLLEYVGRYYVASLCRSSLPSFPLFFSSPMHDNRYANNRAGVRWVHDMGQWSAFLLLFFGVCFVRCVLASLDNQCMLEKQCYHT
jgi:hypothetical protein